MSKLKARFYRWIWLLNPYRLFQGWCALDAFDCSGKCVLIAVTKAGSYQTGRVFWASAGMPLFEIKPDYSGK